MALQAVPQDWASGFADHGKPELVSRVKREGEDGYRVMGQAFRSGLGIQGLDEIGNNSESRRQQTLELGSVAGSHSNFVDNTEGRV